MSSSWTLLHICLVLTMQWNQGEEKELFLRMVKRRDWGGNWKDGFQMYSLRIFHSLQKVGNFYLCIALSSNDYLMLKWLFAKVFVDNFLLANTTPLTLDSAKTPHHDIWHHTKPSTLDTTSHHDTKPLTVPKPEMGKRLEAIKGRTGFFQIEVFPKIKVLQFWGIGGISQTN